MMTYKGHFIRLLNHNRGGRTPSISYVEHANDLGSSSFTPFISEHDFPAESRSQNSKYVVCPYCGFDMEPEAEDYESSDTVCGQCDKHFRVDASFGYGFSTEPLYCKNGHHVSARTREYWYKDAYVILEECLVCDHMVKYNKLEKPQLVPFKPEYNEPAYFDPEGLLNPNGFETIDELIEHRHQETLNGKSNTPVLDALYRGTYKASPKHSEWAWKNAMREVERWEQKQKDLTA